MYEEALSFLRQVNRTIGTGAVLTPEEREALTIHARIQEYIYYRLERGDEIWEREKLQAGCSTRRFDPHR